MMRRGPSPLALRAPPAIRNLPRAEAGSWVMTVRRQIKRARGRRALRAAAGVALAAALLGAAPAEASRILTDTLADDTAPGNCTLREAVEAANEDQPVDACEPGDGDDMIQLRDGTYTLVQGDIVVADPEGDDLLVTGFVDGTRIHAAGPGRIFSVFTPLAVANLRLSGGDAVTSTVAPGDGGAILGVSPPVVPAIGLVGVTLDGNSATGKGGAVHTDGDLSVVNVTATANSVTSATGGGGGALSAAGKLVVNRSTIAGNSVESTGDYAATGGGILYEDQLELTGSIIAGNTADGDGPDCSTPGEGAASRGYNVLQDPEGCSLTTEPTDLTEVDPGLGPLAGNGGPVPTMRPAGPGPAFNLGPAGDACSGLRDARRLPRGTATTGPCDAGAYEAGFCGPAEANAVGTQSGDTMSGPPSPLHAFALPGDDRLIGTAADDHLCGDDGRDLFRGHAGADLMDGGGGVDVVDYSYETRPVAVTLDALANDGAAGEGDRALVESVIGGQSGDLITGDARSNGVLAGKGDDTVSTGDAGDTVHGQRGSDVINGGSGNDQLDGGGGADEIAGADGNDRIDGVDGSDRLLGGNGGDLLIGGRSADTIRGEDGNDRMIGGGGKDKLIGGGGNDFIDGGGGEDTIRCGGGRDRVVADKRDRVAKSCEKVKLR